MTSEESEGAVQIADTAVSMWRSIDTALSPIIGRRGFAALYKRSLVLRCADYPWLTAGEENVLQLGEFADLHTVLSRQPSESAAAAHGALLRTFRDLLNRLIGDALTGQLLDSVPGHTSGGFAARDTST